MLAILLHVIFSSFTAMILSTLVGKLTFIISILSLLIGTAAAWKANQYLMPEYNKISNKHNLTPKLNWFEYVIYGIIIYVGYRQFMTMWVRINGDYFSLLRNNYGDFPLHLTYIRHMAAGAVFPPDNPIWSLDKLRYPLGIDLYNALWECIGLRTQTHFFITGFTLLLSSIFILRRWGGMLLVGAFFLNGGWAGWEFLNNYILNDYQDLLAWKNFYISVFLTQRGFLVALPLGIYLLHTFRSYFIENVQYNKIKIYIISLLWGILPFFHLHSFVVISFVIAVYVLISGKYKQFIPYLYIAVPLATIFILYSTNFFNSASVVSFKPGWENKGNLLVFWWKNIGPWIFFFLAGLGLVIWKGSARKQWEWLGIIVVMVLANTIMLAPWSWDNIKVIIWPYLILVFLVNIEIKPYLNLPRMNVMALILFFSGFICVYWAVSPRCRPVQIYKGKEVVLTGLSLKNVPIDAVITGVPTFNNPIGFFGHKLALGYTAHIWSHGMDPKQQEAKIKQLYRGMEGWENLANELKVTHMSWGPLDRRQFRGGELTWSRVSSNVSPAFLWEMYDIRKTAPGQTNKLDPKYQ